LFFLNCRYSWKVASPLARKPADQTVNSKDIILAAAEVLRNNGYEATTMKDIAAQVNLTAASLYYHFRNKDALLLAVLEYGLDHVVERIEPVVKTDKTNTEKLAEMIKLHVVSVTKNTTVGAAMVFEIRSLMNPKTSSGKSKNNQAFIERRDSFFARRDHFEELFQQVVQAGVDDGEFSPVDVAIFVKTILGAQNWVGVWYREGGRLDGETVAQMMAETFLKALKHQ
jgi:TetR/AcrR family transcriptional regulator, cholesterol catabolism regulator